MNKIIIHWTAGRYTPNKTDLEHYHFLVDGEGKTHRGMYRPEDNENCNDGCYAAHTGGGNTGAIGVAMCAMAGFTGSPGNLKYPITPIQLEACFKLCAELCEKYQIPVENVWTHYEFGKNHPNTSSSGKIDIIWLPPYPNVKSNEIGGFIRNKIRWYSEIGRGRLKGAPHVNKVDDARFAKQIKAECKTYKFPSEAILHEIKASHKT